MDAAASPMRNKQTAPAGPATGDTILMVVLKEGIRRALRALLQVVASARQLARLLARHKGVLLDPLLRVSGALGHAVQLLLSSKPARLFMAAAASIVCISLQCHRSSGANVQMSSSLSLLFGMIKLQGSMAVQLGPVASEQSGRSNNDEFRINCPQGVKEHIVRFLDVQATRDPTAMPAWQISPQKNPAADPNTFAFAFTASPPPRPASPAVQPADSNPTDGKHSACCDAPLPALPPSPPRAPTSGLTAAALLTAHLISAPPASVLPLVDALLPSTPPLGASPPANSPCLGGSEEGDRDDYTGEAKHGSNKLPALKLTVASSSSAAGPGASAQAAAGPAGPAAPSATQPSRGPALQPPAIGPLPDPTADTLNSPAFLATLGPTVEDSPLDSSEYMSLMAYASSYKPSVAMDSPRAAAAAAARLTQRRASESAGGCPPSAAARATKGSGGAPSRPVMKSPDSILGLRGMGLEGWTEGCRTWERLHTE